MKKVKVAEEPSWNCAEDRLYEILQRLGVEQACRQLSSFLAQMTIDKALEKEKTVTPVNGSILNSIRELPIAENRVDPVLDAIFQESGYGITLRNMTDLANKRSPKLYC